MSSFDSTKKSLDEILKDITKGKIQLPDFQRGWVWDDSHIKSLLFSIARSFPIGTIMLLKAGGEARFQIRPIEGVSAQIEASEVEKLILDGQQRLTSLTQVLCLQKPVKTKDEKKRNVSRYYYFNINKWIEEGENVTEETILSVDESKILRENFGRDIVLDLSSIEKEYENFYFPCSQIFDSDDWEKGLMNFEKDKFECYMEFRSEVLSIFRKYHLPVIELEKDNGKEAVCLVFEKVNTGGVPLSVFELVTAAYAADGFNLRDDWYGNSKTNTPGRKQAFLDSLLLGGIRGGGIEPTDFLQGISLLHTYSLYKKDSAAGKTGKELRAVSAKREHVLSMPLSAYKQWADKLVEGFKMVDSFLRQEGLHKPKFLPYKTQLIPLAATMVHLGERWLEPKIKNKLSRWFWSGILGELYGGAVETRIALDLRDLLAWIDSPESVEPKTVLDSNFQADRLDTLRTRTSAAYRGLYVLLQREGAQDFFWKTKMLDLDRDECKIDIHHIFPKAWCNKHSIPPKTYNTIVNKTAISYKANRMIGGRLPPSEYLEKIRTHKNVDITVSEQDEILQSHFIDPDILRADNFDAFYKKRKEDLLALIERTIGKPLINEEQPVPEDEFEDEAD